MKYFMDLELAFNKLLLMIFSLFSLQGLVVGVRESSLGEVVLKNTHDLCF